MADFFSFVLYHPYNIGEEDCLFVNVYVPEGGRNLPVMVWIHGGAFLFSSKNHHALGPQHLVTRGVVVVTVNYRLGPLGFLSLGSEAVPGNAGLTDQVLALRWIQDNISGWGGDPAMVTLFGESAGSLHLLSPLSRGLFHRAVMQSGTALDPSWAPITPGHAETFSRMLATGVGCDKEVAELLTCLQNRMVSQVVNAGHLGTWTPGYIDDIGSVWLPVPDGAFTSSPFLPRPPLEMMQAGQVNPEVEEVIIGMTKDEGVLYLMDVLLDPSQWDSFREEFRSTGPMDLFMDIAFPSEITAEDRATTEQVVRYYVPGGVDNMTADHTQDLFDMFTDASSGWYGLYRTAALLASAGVTVFPYVLTHQGQNSLSQLDGLAGDPVGGSMGDEMWYLWNPVEYVEYNLSREDAAVREVMSEARVGDPSPGPSSGSTWHLAPGHR